jgi:hypothetical protein
MLNGAIMSWTSKRQPVTEISSTESEFYSVSQCAVECVYLSKNRIYTELTDSHSTGQYGVHISYSRGQNVSQSQEHRH